MGGKRKRYSADLKAKVALEGRRGELTTAQLATKHGIHQTMVSEWKKQAVEGLRRCSLGVWRRRRRGSRPRSKSRSCTPRSASCWSSGIFWPRRPVDERRAKAADDRAGASCPVRGAAV